MKLVFIVPNQSHQFAWFCDNKSQNDAQSGRVKIYANQNAKTEFNLKYLYARNIISIQVQKIIQESKYQRLIFSENKSQEAVHSSSLI